MPTEITMLAWSLVLLLIQIVLQGAFGAPELGLPYLSGPRDEGRKPASVYAGRAERALANFSQTFPAFIALALALAVMNKTGGLGATGALVYFWMRVLYVPLYLLGVPYVRTLVWGVSLVGLALMLARLLS